MLKSKKDLVVNYHTHDSLLENKIDQELSEEDKKAAWEEYENEKKGITNKGIINTGLIIYLFVYTYKREERERQRESVCG